MKAWIQDPGPPISPFGDAAGDLPVLGRPLAAVQRRALADAGLEVVEAPPGDEPHLRVGGRCWFTDRLVLRFLAVAGSRPEGARLRLVHPAFQAFTEPLQDLPAPGVHEVALVPAGSSGAPWDALPAVDVAPSLDAVPLPPLHASMAGAFADGIALGEELVHQVDHWSHLLRVNLLALAAWSYREKRRFREAPPWMRAWRLAVLLARARSLDPFRLAAALSVRGRGCRVHPTATVEASVLGRDVEVGPYALVRGSIVCDGAHVEEHAAVNLSVLGAGARVGRTASVNLCVLMDGAMVSKGGGLQASVFGRECFVAMHATVLDLSFGQEVKVLHRGRRVGCGARFLGAAVGHRARIGSGVVLGYGVEVPNDAAVARDPARVLTRWPEDGRPLVTV